MAGPIRLTLRTLLAYLDGALDPSQAQVIEMKIAESDVARKLVERIRQVMSNRELPAPTVTGPGVKISPNIVSEYLDNIIPSDKLDEVEKVLLKSDVMLAEAACSHHVLTLFSTQAAQVPPAAQERIAGLVKDGKPAAARKPVPALPDELDDDDEFDDDEADVGDPLTVRRSKVNPLLPIAGVVGILLIIVAIFFLIRPNGSVSTALASNTSPGTAATGAKPTESSKAKETKAAPPKKDTGKKKDTATKKEPPPKKEPIKKKPIEKMPDTAPSKERKAVGRMLAPPATIPALLLKHENDKWVRLNPDQTINSTESLLAMPGFRSKLLVGGVEVALAGSLPEFKTPPEFPVAETAVVFHSPPSGFGVDVTLDHGRLLFVNLRAENAKVRIRFQNEIWDLNLKDDKTIVGVETANAYPPDVPFHKEPGASDGPFFSAVIYGLRGEPKLTRRYESFALPIPSYYQWNNRGAISPGPQPIPKPPPWYNEPLPTGNARRQVESALEDLDGLVKEKSIGIALAELKNDRNTAARVLRIRCLGALSDLGRLVDAANDATDPVSRQVAIAVLRQWISLRTENELKLYRFLYEEKGFTKSDAETVLDMLHFFTADQLKMPATYEKLIASLKHSKLIIRQLSHFRLVFIVPGQKIPYDPAGNSAALEEAYQSWKKLIPDGKLPPTVKR